jgi:hypothetical protein
VTPKKVAGRWIVVADGKRNEFQSHAEAWRWIERHDVQATSRKERTSDGANKPNDDK